MVGRSNSGYMVKEGQAIFQRGLHLAPLPGLPRTSCKNGRYPQEWLKKRIKRFRMKGHGVSLGIDVLHGDCTIAASEGRLVNVH